jgi:hypothetical protein
MEQNGTQQYNAWNVVHISSAALLCDSVFLAKFCLAGSLGQTVKQHITCV